MNTDEFISRLKSHPMYQAFCLVRTSDSKLFLGVVNYLNPENSKECEIIDALKFLKFSDNLVENVPFSITDGLKSKKVIWIGSCLITNAVEYVKFSEKSKLTYIEALEKQDLD